MKKIKNMITSNNRKHLDDLVDVFKQWLHIEDIKYIWTLGAMRITHQLEGDPCWMMIIGPSSDGKTEFLKAFTKEVDVTVDDISSKAFVSGMKKYDENQRYLAERIANNLWFIYDMSIMLSKRAEERSMILSDMRMIYDGRIVKEFGNHQRISIDTPNNTLIAASTPEIDRTMLEDALLGTRFMTYRIQTMNRFAVMDMIDINENRKEIMRESLNIAVKQFLNMITVEDYDTGEVENMNLQTMANMTTLLRTSVSLDKNGEPANIAYPEGAGRLYKQIKKLYKAYRIIGLSENESLDCVRKICIDNIDPRRIKVMRYIYDNTKKDQYGMVKSFTTSNISQVVHMGKKTVKSICHIMAALGLLNYTITEEHFHEIDNWTLLDSNIHLMFKDKKFYFGLGRNISKYLIK